MQLSTQLNEQQKSEIIFKQSHRTQYPSHWPVRWPKGEAWSPVIEDSTHNKWKDERRARWRHGIVGFRASTDPATLPAGCRRRPLSVPHTNVDRSCLPHEQSVQMNRTLSDCSLLKWDILVTAFSNTTVFLQFN